MKLALFAAAALFATPALAQTTGGAGSGTPVGPDAKAAAATGQSSIDTPSSMPATPSSPMSTGTMNVGGDPVGGYQPSQPMPMATGGVQPVFTPGPSVAQAYPAPAPLASYPVCKKGQYDKCMQRGGR